MHAVDLLRNRVGATNAMMHDMAEQLSGLDLTEPVAPGTSPLGLTFWHLPRTQDWAVQAVIRDVPEVADGMSAPGLPDPTRWGFGIALTPEEAREVATEVNLASVLEYADALYAEIDRWLSGLSEADLDVVPDWSAHLQRREVYATAGYAEEAGNLPGTPAGVLLLRPVTSHVIHHLGEMDLLAQLARR